MILQIITIVCSRGDVLALGEAYAFGVVWSFVFMSLSMLILRFKRPEHREYEVPFNIRVGRFDIPVGMTLIFLVLAVVAIANLLTKEVATITGVAFTAGFLRRVLGQRACASPPRRHGRRVAHEHLEQFNQQQAEQLSVESLHVDQALPQAGGDPLAVQPGDARALPGRDRSRDDRRGGDDGIGAAARARATCEPTITVHDRQLLTAVVNLAEHAGKPVKPVIVPTNEPFFAMARTAKTIGAQELIMGQSNKFRPEDQLDQVALYWLNVCGAKPEPLSIRVLAQGPRRSAGHRRRQPDPQDRRAARRDRPHPLRASQELARRRAAAPGLRRQPLERRFSRHGHELPRPGDLGHADRRRRERARRTALDPIEEAKAGGRARRRAGASAWAATSNGESRAARPARKSSAPPSTGKFDAIFMSLRGVYRRGDTTAFASNTRYVLEHAPCRVILGFAPKSIPPNPPRSHKPRAERPPCGGVSPPRAESRVRSARSLLSLEPRSTRPHLRGSLLRPNSASRGTNWFQVSTVRQVAC